jgi:hypothetical protein
MGDGLGRRVLSEVMDSTLQVVEEQSGKIAAQP